MYIVFTKPLQRGSAPAWPSLTNRHRTRTHTHTQTQRQRRRGGASAGHTAPADRGRPSLRKNSKRWSHRGGGGSLHLSRPSWLRRSLASSHAADKKRKKKKERKERNEETTNPRQTLNLVNPRPKWYTLLTQNGQSLYMWPSLPFIDQGGKHLTTWGLFPREPPYPLCVHPLHRADLLASIEFPLVAENLHDSAF